MNTKFKVGDEVEFVSGKNIALKIGDRATVKKTDSAGTVLLVSDDIIKQGWGLGVWCCGRKLRLVKPFSASRKVIIVEDGMTVTAKLLEGKKLIKEASAKCSPDDTFDFGIGANLAFTRLGVKPQKPLFRLEDYPGRVVMHCPTREADFRFRRFLDSAGRHWQSGQRYTEWSQWSKHGSETCHAFNGGTYEFCDYFARLDYKILEFDDFYWPELKPHFSTERWAEAEFGSYNEKLVQKLDDAGGYDWALGSDGAEVNDGYIGNTGHKSCPEWEYMA